MDKEGKRTYFDRFFIISVTQLICVATVITAILVTKYFFPDIFRQIDDFYEKYFLTETVIYEDTADEI